MEAPVPPPEVAPSDAFDGLLYVLHGGEAASQVAADLAAQAQGRGFEARLLSMERFKEAQLDTCAGRSLPHACFWR